ncbi:tRNA wybutosine-synthesizing protein [Phlyctema vagabunda]|uniref:tRNA wybutosine-synthesizing protein 2 n=1 Tax=Phlyctema vagabunda TaxID=108571 RepID=A0ABR4PDU1_9HELO
MRDQTPKDAQIRPPKAKPLNPIEAAVKSWQNSLPAHLLPETLQTLLTNIPKRWVAYPPMMLLPSGSFNFDCITDGGSQEALQSLWEQILQHVSKREGKGPLTHLAINAGIPLHQTQEDENILRSPSGLIMLYGDFGPALDPLTVPTSKDFQDAFWVSTKQNGIVQVWAPRYTMFSRGNVKEKARLLDFHSVGNDQISERRRQNISELSQQIALDLYAGIGYFVFSYAKMGLRRVLGWELNPWSVEGLRRGAVANGWSVKVVSATEDFTESNEQIVVFLGDNTTALNTMRASFDTETQARVRHVNCGFLPTSEPSWHSALNLIDNDGWLHLHENVGVVDVESRRAEIEKLLQDWLHENGTVTIEHVELVKTFAPGVWHCVFDAYISRRKDSGQQI